MAQALKGSGVTGMYLSADAFHQEFLPLELLHRNARMLVEAGIERLEWNVCWLISPEHDNPWNERTRQILKALADLPVHLDIENLIIAQPAGRARQHLAGYFPPPQPVIAGRCGDMAYTAPLDRVRIVGINSRGDLEACYSVRLGRLQAGDAAEQCERWDPCADPLLKIILEQGPVGLADEAARRGLKSNPLGWYTVCEMCSTLRRRLGSLSD